jgi:hypothetical protein
MSMSQRPHPDLAGAELAGEVLHDGGYTLLAFLVPLEDGDGLELGAWSTAGDGKLARPARPLVFPIGDVDRVRGLAERAAAALAQAPFETDDSIVLAEEGSLRASVARGPDGVRWATLGWADGSGLAVVPAAAIASLVRVLAEAERLLAELGLLAFPRDLPG